MVGVVAGEQRGIPDEHSQGFQDERGEELDVDEIAGTAQPPVDKPRTNKNKTIILDFEQILLIVQGLKCTKNCERQTPRENQTAQQPCGGGGSVLAA